MKHSRGVLTVNLQNLRENYRILAQKAGESCAVAAVVKADGYGLGAVSIAGDLIQAGCRDFFVATPEEGLELRAAHKDINIYVLNGFYASYAEHYPAQNLVPVLGSFMEIESYTALAQKHGRALPTFLNFNTRMNRMGLGALEAEELIADMDRLGGLEIMGVMSHFACADEADHPMNETQYELFAAIAAHFPKAKKSLCNSSGIFRDSKYHFDMVRPGMALYGLNPTSETDNPMKPVITLEVPVIRTRIVYKDAVVGYGATYRFDKKTQIATLSAGYADGIFWALSNKGAFYWNGYECPIRGRISMDMTSVDLCNVPQAERPKPGDYLELIGPHQSPAQLAAGAGSFDYEILTALGHRYRRLYINSAGDQSHLTAFV